MAFKPLRRGIRLHDRVVRLLRNGLDTPTIARRTGCRPIQIAAIRAHLTRGSYRRKPRWGPHLMGERDRQRMVRMFSEDVDVEVIARRLGRSRRTIRAMKAHYTMGTYSGLVGSRKLIG